MSDLGLNALEPRGKEPARVATLQQWVNTAAEKVDVASERLSWFVASTVVMGVLQRVTHVDGSALFLVKGGAFIERRLQLKARSTKDVDAVFRGSLADFTAALTDATAEDWGPFALTVRDMGPISGARTRISPQRFNLQLSIKGQVFRKVKVEVSFGEGHLAAHSEVLAVPRLDYFGIDAPDVIATITMAYQVAQKLHAATDPDTAERQNDRVRDIVDLILIRNAFYPEGTDLAPVLEASEDIFAARAAVAVEAGAEPRAWPPKIENRALWPSEWATPSGQVNLDMELEQALAEVQAWVDAIAAAEGQSPTNSETVDG